MKLCVKFALDGSEPDNYIHLSLLNGFHKNIVGDAECTEILADDLIDYIPLEKMGEILGWIRSKMRHGCKLILGGTDIYEVSRAFSSYYIGLNDLNKLLYAQNKSAVLTLPALVELVQQLGLKIISKRVNGYKMVVIAEREKI